MEQHIRHINRIAFYAIITWFLLGALIVWMGLFTYQNGFRHLSFSRDDGGIYELRKGLASSGTLTDDHYEMGFWVELGHENEKFLKITADGISNNNTIVTLYAGIIDNIGQFTPTCRVYRKKLTNGNNYYRLDTNDFNYALLYVDGIDKVVIKEIQFTESNVEMQCRESLKVIIISILIYLFITFTCVLLIKRIGR